MQSRIETLLNAIVNGDTISGFKPQSRAEEYLLAAVNKSGTEGLPNPQSRLDALLYLLADMMPESYGSDFEAGAKLGNLVEESAVGLLTVPYINPNKHKIEVKLSSDTVTDFSGVKVKVLGENLIPYPYYETTKTQNGITFTDNGDGSITVNGTATADATFRLCPSNSFTYSGQRKLSLSGCPSGGSSSTYNIQMSGYPNMRDTGTGYSYAYFYSYEINPLIVIKSGATVNNIVFKPQLTRMDASLIFHKIGYIPYTETVYTANADGTVDGITSIAPTMNLITSKGIIITCKSYKADDYQWNIWWDFYQNHGLKSSWVCAFSYGWTDSTFQPKFPIIGGSEYGLREAFRNSSITDIKVPLIDRVGNIQTTFNYCNQLKRIPLLRFEKPLTVANSSSFANCYSLEELNIEGEIAVTGLTLQYSTKLNHDSIISVVNALSTTTTGMSVTLSLTAVKNAFETSEGAADGNTSEEWTALIATRSNWTISLV